MLHNDHIVCERYNGVMGADQPHIAFSEIKSYFGTSAEILIAESKFDETAVVTHCSPELEDSGFGDATVRQVAVPRWQAVVTRANELSATMHMVLSTPAGIRGQTIYVDPKAEIVIVRLASNPQGSNVNFDHISLPAYQAISEKLMKAK